VLLETFVDPKRFHGTVYRASNWIYVGKTKGFHRTGQGYSNQADSPKMVFLKPLVSNVQALLSGPVLKKPYLTGGQKIMLSAEHMKSLPDFFAQIPDPRRPQGRRHQLSTVLAIATAATLCGMRGYLAISDWVNGLGQKALERFRCRYENKRYVVPSQSTIRDVLVRVDPTELDKALQRWNLLYGEQDQSLAIDGKTHAYPIDTGCIRCLEMTILVSDSPPTQLEFEHLFPGGERLCPHLEGIREAHAARVTGLELQRCLRVWVATCVFSESGEPVLIG
jgi:hypothetical protein